MRCRRRPQRTGDAQLTRWLCVHELLQAAIVNARQADSTSCSSGGSTVQAAAGPAPHSSGAQSRCGGMLLLQLCKLGPLAGATIGSSPTGHHALERRSLLTGAAAPRQGALVCIAVTVALIAAIVTSAATASDTVAARTAAR